MSFPLSHVGSTELPSRVADYTPAEVQAELDRVVRQSAADAEYRAKPDGSRRFVSTPEFWEQREQVLRRALCGIAP